MPTTAALSYGGSWNRFWEPWYPKLHFTPLESLCLPRILGKVWLTNLWKLAYPVVANGQLSFLPQ